MTESIKHYNISELKEVFVGRKVTDTDKTAGVLTLDNGVKVRVIPNEGADCCDSGHYFLENLESFEHVIMNVRVKDKEIKNKKRFDLYVYAAKVKAHQKVITVSGSDGNGYYGTGFSIEVMEV